MVTIKDVLREYHPLGTCAPAPPKPPKMAKFNVYYWHRRYPTHKPLKANARIDRRDRISIETIKDDLTI
jgi:hypothetical protein